MDQQNFEGYESVNKAKGKGIVSLAVACNSNAGEDNGISPLMEQLSMTKIGDARKKLKVLKRARAVEDLFTEENWEDDPHRPKKSSKTAKSRQSEKPISSGGLRRKSVGPASSKSKLIKKDILKNPEEPTIAPKSKEKTIGESLMKSGRVKYMTVKKGREIVDVEISESSQHEVEQQPTSKVARSSYVNQGTENIVVRSFVQTGVAHKKTKVSKRTKVMEDLYEDEDWEDEPLRPSKVQKTKLKASVKTTSSSQPLKKPASAPSKAKIIDKKKMVVEEATFVTPPQSKRKAVAESPMKTGRVKHSVSKQTHVITFDSFDESSQEDEQPISLKSAKSTLAIQRVKPILESSPLAHRERTLASSRGFKTPSPIPSSPRDSNLTPGVFSFGPEVALALSSHFNGLFDVKAQIEKETSIGAQNVPIEANVQENMVPKVGSISEVPIIETDAQANISSSHESSILAKVEVPISIETIQTSATALSTYARVQLVQTETTFKEETEATCIDDDDDDGNDVLKRLEDILSKRSLSLKSHHSTTHSEVEVQSISAPQLLKELIDLLKLGVDPVIAAEDKKQKLLSLLDQLNRNKHLLNSNAQSIVQELIGLTKDLPTKIPSLDQVITNNQQLLNKKSQLMVNVAKAKKKRSKLTIVLSTTQQNINQNEERILELEQELQILKEQQRELRALAGDCANQEQTLNKDCQRWTVKCNHMKQAIQDLAPSFEAASTEKKRIIDTWESLYSRVQ